MGSQFQSPNFNPHRGIETFAAALHVAASAGLCLSTELVDDSQKDEEDHQSHHNLNFNKQNNENQIIFYIEFAIWHVALNFKK